MRQVLAAFAFAALVLACAAARGESSEPPHSPGPVAVAATALASTDSVAAAPTAPAADPILDALCDRMDKRAAEIRTLSADVTITNRVNFANRESKRTGKIYVRKPDDLFLDLAKPYPRKIWISSKEILDYRPDQKTGERVKLAAENSDESKVIGLSTTMAELKNRFDIRISSDAARKGQCVLVLTPKEGVKVDFTSAEVTVDEKSLLPVKIAQVNSELDEVKTYDLSNIRENPSLAASLFEPRLDKNAQVEDFEPSDWKGP